MKSIIRAIFVNFLSFWLISLLIGAIAYENIGQLIFAAFIFSFLNWLVKPLINLVFLPLNLVSLGSFRWIVNLIVLFLVVLIAPGFKILDFTFAGINSQGVVIPTIKFNIFLTYLLVSFLLKLISDIIYSLFK